MKVRLGLLRQYIREAVSMTRTTSPSAPTDPDATVPGHLPNELPPSATLSDEEINGGGLDEDSWVPGRWFPSECEPMLPGDADRLGEDGDLDETDDRTLGDGEGPGIPAPNDNPDGKMSPHLRTDDDTSLGSPPEEKPREGFYGESWLNREIRRYMLQEYPAGAGMVDPTKEPLGAYTHFDMDKDHGSVTKMQGAWYKSPGRTPGEDGDPFRGTDPNAQLGFHPPAGDKNPDAAPPATMGMDGAKSRRAPRAWPLGAGDDTSKVLGANAHPANTDVGSGDESEAGEEGERGTEGDEAQGEEQE